jgi:hypothetical protein
VVASTDFLARERAVVNKLVASCVEITNFLRRVLLMAPNTLVDFHTGRVDGQSGLRLESQQPA